MCTCDNNKCKICIAYTHTSKENKQKNTENAKSNLVTQAESIVILQKEDEQGSNKQKNGEGCEKGLACDKVPVLNANETAMSLSNNR